MPGPRRRVAHGVPRGQAAARTANAGAACRARAFRLRTLFATRLASVLHALAEAATPNLTLKRYQEHSSNAFRIVRTTPISLHALQATCLLPSSARPSTGCRPANLRSKMSKFIILAAFAVGASLGLTAGIDTVKPARMRAKARLREVRGGIQTGAGAQSQLPERSITACMNNKACVNSLTSIH